MPPYTPETAHQSATFGPKYAAPTLVPLLSVIVRRSSVHTTNPADVPQLAAPTKPQTYGGATTRPGFIAPQRIDDPVFVQPSEPKETPPTALDQIKNGYPAGAAVGAVAGAGMGLWWGKSPAAAGVGGATGAVVGYFGGTLLGGLVGGLAGYIAGKVFR